MKIVRLFPNSCNVQIRDVNASRYKHIDSVYCRQFPIRIVIGVKQTHCSQILSARNWKYFEIIYYFSIDLQISISFHFISIKPESKKITNAALNDRLHFSGLETILFSLTHSTQPKLLLTPRRIRLRSNNFGAAHTDVLHSVRLLFFHTHQ